MSRKINLTSFENSSLLRKLTIMYFLASIVPMVVLWYFYLQLLDTGRIEITTNDLQNTLFWVVLGVMVGFFILRSTVMSIVDISRTNRNALKDLLGAEKIKSIHSGTSNEIAILAKSFNEITSRLEENVRNLELAKRTLHSVLARVGEGISSMENIDSFLNLILETVTEAMGCGKGCLLLLDRNSGEFYVQAIYGKGNGGKDIRLKADVEFLQPVLQAHQSMIVDQVSKDAAVLNGLVRAPAICAPLMLHDQVLGVLVVSGRTTEQRYDDEEKNLLNNLALQTAVAIENSRLNEDAEKTYFETISALALAVEAKDPYSRGHSDRVANYAVRIAEHLQLGAGDIKALRDAAKLHDLGKIGVMDKVLKKPAALNAQEMEMMKKHPEIGEGIIKPIRSLKNLCDLIRHHHEKLDGSGYPDGLKAEQIHPLVRVLQVADIYDALTTNRPYRDPFTPEKAIETLRSMRNQVDLQIVDALESVISA